MPATLTQHFAKAKLLARCHDRASPEMFMRLMKLDGDTARGGFNLLQDKGVIGNGIDGITRAINPLNTHCVPNEAVRATDLAKMASDIAKRVRDMAKRRLEAVEKELADDAPEPETSDPEPPKADA
ncbi:MAG: hypothetical protein P8Q26_04235 [Ascidiaceihabitans sp.]|nr:hypothetical protein [Ascidiaceihabitans sp.]